MSLAQLAAQTHAINPAATNRILILDVERLPGITEQRWWDRGDLKNRYIHHETVTREPRTTIVCAKWYGEPDVMRFAEWDKGGRGRFLKRVHALVKEADLIVGHNVIGADVPWLWGDFYLPRIGHKHRPRLAPLPEPKTYDTYKVLKRFKSGMPFKGLDAALQILGLGGKTDRYDPDAMERAVAGSVEDQQRQTEYCVGDVIGGEIMYDWSRPHGKNMHPAIQLAGEDNWYTCRPCGGELKPIAERWVADVFSYSMGRCVDCGWHGKINIGPERISIVRGV